MTNYLLAISCVIGIAIGQILFKLSALSLQRTKSLFDPGTAVILFSALCLYGITTIAWVWVLQKFDLSRVYPLMALAFIFVPIGGYIFLGERFQPQYFFGVALIIAGIIVTLKS